MKGIARWVLALWVAAGTTSLWAQLDDLIVWDPKPQVGADAGYVRQRFDAGFGDQHFSENYPYTHFYIGSYLNQYVGVEFGYKHRYRQQKGHYYFANNPVLGFVNPNIPDARFQYSEAFTHGWSGALVGYWPICPRTRTELFGLVGISWLKMSYTIDAILDAVPATERTFLDSDTRALARLGIGVRQMITRHFGMRLIGEWEDTSRLESTIPVSVSQGGVTVPLLPSDNYTVKPKSSYSVGLGFFFQVA